MFNNDDDKRKRGVEERTMPFEVCRRMWTRSCLYIGGISVESHHHSDVWKESASILVPNHTSTLGTAFTLRMIGSFPFRDNDVVFLRIRSHLVLSLFFLSAKTPL